MASRLTKTESSIIRPTADLLFTPCRVDIFLRALANTARYIICMRIIIFPNWNAIWFLADHRPVERCILETLFQPFTGGSLSPEIFSDTRPPGGRWNRGEARCVHGSVACCLILTIPGLARPTCAWVPTVRCTSATFTIGGQRILTRMPTGIEPTVASTKSSRPKLPRVFRLKLGNFPVLNWWLACAVLMVGLRTVHGANCTTAVIRP